MEYIFYTNLAYLLKSKLFLTLSDISEIDTSLLQPTLPDHSGVAHIDWDTLGKVVHSSPNKIERNCLVVGRFCLFPNALSMSLL